jgi:hypothetical protein
MWTKAVRFMDQFCRWRRKRVLVLQIRRATILTEATKKLDSVIENVPSTYKPLLRPALNLQIETLGVAEDIFNDQRANTQLSPTASPSRRRARVGELFTDGNNLFAVAVRDLDPGASARRNPDGSITRIPRPDAKSALSLYLLSGSLDPAPLSGLEEYFNKALDIELQPSHITSNRLDELKAEGMESPQMPSDEELSSARLLADRPIRTLALAVKSSGGLLIGDLPKQLPPGSRDRVDEIRSAILAAGLVSAEIVVICKTTHEQVARAPSADVINELSGRGVKCACGRPIGDERIEQALDITDLGRFLLDKSRWFSLLLLTELTRLGIPLDRILLDQQSGGDELDCVADISGELTFFELKDKEFSLGNAYSFGAKIGIIRPRYRVIVTTEHVGNDAKEHFQRSETAVARRRYEPEFYEVDEPKAIWYIEGTNNLRPKLEELVTEIYAEDAARMLSDVLPFASLNPSALLKALQRKFGSETPELAGQSHQPRKGRSATPSRTSTSVKGS